jgi:hypothetical protein
MPKNERRIYVARESFVTDYNGAPTVVHADITRVREGHPLMSGREHMFKEIDAHYEVEEAINEPGRARGERNAHAA